VVSLVGSAAFGWVVASTLGSRSLHKRLKEQQTHWERWSEFQICRGLGLMTPEQAQHTQCVHLEKLLSASEIADLLNFSRSFWSAHVAGHGPHDAERQLQLRGVQWRTAYLHTGNLFAQRFPALQRKLRRAILEIDAVHWQVLNGRECSRLNFRTVEYHEYGPAGSLTASRHYDAGSLVTLDVMLSEPGTDFKGGELAMPQSDGSNKLISLGKGDAAVFLSHKYHNVLPVLEGERAVLVVELWDGPQRTCPHRCLSLGACGQSLTLEQTRVGGVDSNLSSDPDVRLRVSG